MNNESIFKTFGVATGVCVVCAIIVSFSSVALKGLQDQNKLLDKQVNVLKAAGLVPTDGKATKAEADEMFKSAEIVVVDLATGAVVADADPNKVESDKANVVALTPEQDLAKIKTAPKQAVVYRFNDENGALKTLVRTGATGLYHLSGGSRGTARDVAEFIAERRGFANVQVAGISSKEYGFSAPQSAFTALRSMKYGDLDGVYRLPDWRSALADYLDWRDGGK